MRQAVDFLEATGYNRKKEIHTMQANRKYKDSVFTRFFSEDPRRLVELYNAVAGTNYPKDTEIVINTLDDVLYKDRVNDLSFTIDGQLVVLVEHQSTPNENMPLRMLMYLGRLYEKMLEPKMLYKSSRIPLPEPKFIVLYNGVDSQPRHYRQHLTDAFVNPSTDLMADIAVDVWNINYDENDQLFQESDGLEGYSKFVTRVREMTESGLPLGEAIKEVLRIGSLNKSMQEFLNKHGSEVENMLNTEWNWDDALKVQRQEGREEGLTEGHSAGLAEGLAKGLAEKTKSFCDLVANGLLKLTDAIQFSGCSETEFKNLMHQYYPEFKC